MIKELFEDILTYLPSKIVPAIVGLTSIPIVTRLFPPEDYGNYVLVLATVSIFSTIVGWIPMSVIRFFPAYAKRDRLDEFYDTTIKLTLISVGILAFAYLVILLEGKGRMSEQFYYLMRIGILVFVVQNCFVVSQQFLRVKRQVKWYTVFSIWHGAMALGLGVALVMIFHFGVDGLVWGSLLSTAIVFPFLWKAAMEMSPRQVRGISIPLTTEMAKYGFPLVVGNLAAWVLSLSDRYILELFRGSKEVGIYSVSYYISEHSIALIVSLFVLASGPIGINIWEQQGNKATKEFVSKLTRYYLIICLPAVIGLGALAKPLITIFAARQFFEGYKIFPLVAFGAFFIGLQWIFQFGLRYHKRTHLTMFCFIASGLLNIGLTFLLVPRYGYMAAAVTTFISYVFLLILVIVLSRHLFIWEFPFKSLAKVVCASTIMGTVVYPIGNSLTSLTLVNLILGICVGIAVYFLMLLLFRECKPRELPDLLDDFLLEIYKPQGLFRGGKF